MSPQGSQGKHSPWKPFRHKNYAVLWTATLVANIGVWMYASSAAWLMTTLTTDPLLVASVQVAASLPLFLFALPAGALADIVDERHLLIAAESVLTVVSAVFAALVWLDLVTPLLLLLFVFSIQACAALAAPAWQSIVPRLVPREELPQAVAANSVGVNISRAIGPALGGLLTVALGIAAPFWANAAANLGTVASLAWWRSARHTDRGLPAERFASAMRVGFRHAWNNAHLRSTLARAAGFFIFASAYWALLPLVAREQLSGGPELYGILLGAIGAGAVGGAFLLPRINAKLGPDRLVSACMLGTAGTLVLFGAATNAATAVTASLIAGICWIAVLSSLNVSVQYALPDWVRGRGLAIYVTVFFGAMMLGSALWGQIARVAGLQVAHFIAAGGALLAIVVTWRWKLQTGALLDLTPSMHWPAPIVSNEIAHDQGPVMVTVEYRVVWQNRTALLLALQSLARERRRNGAYGWGVFEDTAQQGRFIETFFTESWVEHLRQHQRVTNADRVLQEQMEHLLEGPPKVTHLIAADASVDLPASGPE